MDDLLTIEEYAQAVSEALSEVVGGDTVTVHEITKNNGEKVLAVTIMGDDTNLAPAINLKEYYKEYLESGFSKSANSILECYKQYKVKGFADFSFLKTYEKVKHGIMPRLVDYETNKGILKDRPHMRYLDLAVMFHYLVKNEDGRYGAIVVTNSLQEIWGKTSEELFLDAMRNMEKSVYINSLADEISSLMGVKEEWGQLDECIYDMHMLTNYASYYGSASLLSEKSLYEFAVRMGCRHVMILMPSVHEALLLPKREQYDTTMLRGMINNIRSSGTVLKEDMLSGNVYMYEIEKRKISIA